MTICYLIFFEIQLKTLIKFRLRLTTSKKYYYLFLRPFENRIKFLTLDHFGPEGILPSKEVLERQR